jgi:hypothetical protein
MRTDHCDSIPLLNHAVMQCCVPLHTAQLHFSLCNCLCNSYARNQASKGLRPSKHHCFSSIGNRNFKSPPSVGPVAIFLQLSVMAPVLEKVQRASQRSVQRGVANISVSYWLNGSIAICRHTLMNIIVPVANKIYEWNTILVYIDESLTQIKIWT